MGVDLRTEGGVACVSGDVGIGPKIEGGKSGKEA